MSNIHLTLSSKKPWDTTYRTPGGQVIYKVESATPMPGARSIKISKIMPSLFDNETATEGREVDNLKDSFAHLATVEYHAIRTSRIRMGDLDVATDDYFRKEGWSLTSLGRLVFLSSEPRCLSVIRLGIGFLPDQTEGNTSGNWGK